MDLAPAVVDDPPPFDLQLRLHAGAALRVWAAVAQLTGANAPRHVARHLAPRIDASRLLAAVAEGIDAAAHETDAAVTDVAKWGMIAKLYPKQRAAVPAAELVSFRVHPDDGTLTCSGRDWDVTLASVPGEPAADLAADWQVQLRAPQDSAWHHALVQVAALCCRGDEWPAVHAAARGLSVTLSRDVQVDEAGVVWEDAPVVRYADRGTTNRWRVGVDDRGAWWAADFAESSDAAAPALSRAAAYGPYATRQDAVMVAEVTTAEFGLAADQVVYGSP